MVEGAGIEPASRKLREPSLTPEVSVTSDQGADSVDAGCGAECGVSVSLGPAFETLAQLWPHLSPEVQTSLLAVARAAAPPQRDESHG